MKILLASALIVLAAGPSAAQDFELEFTEQGLNQLLHRLGDPGSQGIHQPNALSGLGYGNCVAIATLDCVDGSDRPTAQPGTARQRVRLSSCKGPNGQSAIVPSAEPVTWQWWITQARFTIAAQQLNFVANVRYRVGMQWFNEERTVPATLSLDTARQRLRMEVSSFKVPVRYSANGTTETVTEVDVGRHMSFGIPIGAQSFQVADLEGRIKTLTSRAESASVEYQAGKVQVKVDAAFY